MKKLFLLLPCLLILTCGYSCKTTDGNTGGSGFFSDLFLRKTNIVKKTVVELPRVTEDANGILTTNAGPVTKVLVSPSGDRIEIVQQERSETNTVYSPKTGIVETIQTARGVGGLIPGWGGIIDGLGGIAIAGLTWYARKKNDHASAASILIEGIEKTAGSEAVKATVQDLALKAGKSDLVHGLVQKVTGGKI